MALTPAEASRLASASAHGVLTSARRVAGHLPGNSWLGARNRYRVSTIAILEADDKGHTVQQRQLAEYIASSAPLHCCDAWSYLGRAIGCHLHGDPNAARHLAYYAELRAAIALLATQGIGIFNDRHFVIDQNAAVTRLCTKKGTHRATWEVLEAWASLPQASTALGNVLLPGGRPMSDWIASLPGGASWQPLATDWLLTMGLDLRFLSDDRDARNEASYRPMYLRQLTSLPSPEAASVAEEMWHLLEPAPPLSFDRLDRHLLRLSLEGAVRSTRGPRTLRNAPQFARLVEAAVRACVDSGSQAGLWTSFLLRSDEPDDPRTLSLAREVRQVWEPDHHVAVMARALLLLRVASGATRQLLADSGIGFDRLAFWWGPYGEGRGLWDETPAATELTNGWADFEAVLQDIRAWLDGSATSDLSYRRLLTEVPRSMTTLTNMELVGLWSLAS